MYKIMLPVFFISMCLDNIHAQQLPDNRILQPAAMQQDFSYLRKALEDTHPGLYMHHTKQEMQYKMDSLYALLYKPLSFFKFYKVVAYLIAEVKCEHTYCNPYSGDFGKIARQWKVLPFQLFFTNDKAYVAINLTTDTGIHLGDEILSVNRYPIDSIKHEIYRYLPADGNMETSKEKAISSMLFNISYYLFIERPDAFDITFKSSGGEIYTRHFQQLSTPDESNKIAIANPANKQVLELDRHEKQERKNPNRLEFAEDKNMAVLTVRDLGSDRKKLFTFYEKSFSSLRKKNTANLIIDLSYNGGGDEEYAAELLTYLSAVPFRFINEEYLLTDSSYYLQRTNLPKEALSHMSNYLQPRQNGRILAKEQTAFTRELKLFTPKPDMYKGHVYFYVNGGTSSAASTCAAVAQSNHLATIVGEETGGCYAGGGAAFGLELTLPNSGIFTHTSIVYQNFATTGGQKDRGVIPDYHFLPTFQDVISGNDSWKAYIYNLIKKQ